MTPSRKFLTAKRIADINRQTNERYNKRLDKKGPGAYALGWGTGRYQVKRFHDLLHAVGQEFFRKKRVADIGCGFGDLYAFLKREGARPKAYLGIDVNERFIKFASRAFQKDECVSFMHRDLILKPLRRGMAQTGVALGVINYKQEDHAAYAKRFIRACFTSVSDALAVNVISAVRNKTYQKEMFIYYYDPAEWLKWAQEELTPFCSIIHDYAGEPQHEFFLILRKKPWKP
jgi:SAM-dependent methyltransferase